LPHELYLTLDVLQQECHHGELDQGHEGKGPGHLVTMNSALNHTGVACPELFPIPAGWAGRFLTRTTLVGMLLHHAGDDACRVAHELWAEANINMDVVNPLGEAGKGKVERDSVLERHD